MTKKEILQKIEELKSDYIRIQGDIEKLENTGNRIEAAEKHLSRIEEELKRLRALLAQYEWPESTGN